jgi:broad specificity phosphatase PhoE
MTLGWDNPVADPTTTVLLRHGDTQLSPEHRFSGLRDLPLSANGTRQAQAAAGRLASGAPIDAVVSSPLQRAVATAAIAAGELGLTAATDDDLRETDFGDWDGFTLEEIQQRWPAAAAAWRRDPGQAPPGGESFVDTARRVNLACDRLLRDHGGQTVLVVSHVTRSCCAGLSASRSAPSTGCISVPPASTRSSGTAADLPPSIASTTPATFPDSLTSGLRSRPMPSGPRPS